MPVRAASGRARRRTNSAQTGKSGRRAAPQRVGIDPHSLPLRAYRCCAGDASFYRPRIARADRACQLGGIMKYVILASMLTASVAFAPMVFANDESGASSDTSHHYVKDSVITTKVKSKLAAKHLSTLTHIKVDTDENGVVYLSGRAQSRRGRHGGHDCQGYRGCNFGPQRYCSSALVLLDRRATGCARRGRPERSGRPRGGLSAHLFHQPVREQAQTFAERLGDSRIITVGQRGAEVASADHHLARA